MKKTSQYIKLTFPQWFSLFLSLFVFDTFHHPYLVCVRIHVYVSVSVSWRSGKRPRLRARRVNVRFSLREIILSLENLNVIIRAIN